MVPTINFKPLLFVSLSGVSALSVYSSLVLNESKGKEKLKESFKAVSSPFLSGAEITAKGLGKLYDQLSIWAKSVLNQQDSFIKWIKERNSFAQDMHDGTRLIFKNIKEWIEILIKEVPQALLELLKNPEKIRDKIYYFTPFVWNTFSALSSSSSGSGSFIFKFANLVGNDKFVDLAKALEKNKELLSDNQKASEILEAFDGDAQKTVEALEKLKGENLNKALKTLSLVGRIKEANSQALVLVEKGKTQSLSEEDRKKGTELKNKMNKLHEELEKTIDEAKKQLKLKEKKK